MTPNTISLSVILMVLIQVGCQNKTVSEDNEDDFIDLFNQRDMSGWEGDEPYWSVQEGILIGTITDSTRISANRFLIYQGEIPSDFELRVEFKVSKDGNSGINYRSEVIDGLDYRALRGYQYDIDGQMSYTGSNYEEKRRSTLASIGESVLIPSISTTDSLKFRVKNKWTKSQVQELLASPDEIKTLLDSTDWNRARIIAKGNDLSHYLNEVLISRVVDNDTIHRRQNGKLGVQVHVGPSMEIAYKSIRIKEL